MEEIGMDCEKIGKLILKLRRDRELTQKQLADKLFISDKAISKWERGLGCPDISLIPILANELGITMDSLIAGEVDINDSNGGNMKNLKFYICDTCDNIITTTHDAEVSCCGRRLKALTPEKACDEDKLDIKLIENDYYISSDHPMTKDNYISFVALLSGDSIMIRKQYPQWDLQIRIPNFARGKLVWYSTHKGLLYQFTNLKK